MVAGPTADGGLLPLGDATDGFFEAVGPGRDEAEFWTEADRAHPSRRTRRTRHHRAARRRRPAPAAAAAHPPIGRRPLPKRIAAAWAAEASARRALRGGPVGGPPPSRRNRKLAAGVVGIAALLVLAVAVADSTLRDDPASEQAGSPSTDGSISGGSSASPIAGSLGDEEAVVVESEIVDAVPTRKPTTKKPAAKPKAKPSAAAPAAAPKPTTPAPSAGPAPAPKPVPPVATPVPTTAAPTPTTPPPTPTTTAPKPVTPRVQSFTATTAATPGGACSALQWATTLAWNTSDATSVSITGLLEPTRTGGGDGSVVACRALPGAPLGGWTLTATGAGGTATATA